MIVVLHWLPFSPWASDLLSEGTQRNLQKDEGRRIGEGRRLDRDGVSGEA